VADLGCNFLDRTLQPVDTRVIACVTPGIAIVTQP
jgi:hypothetical protein